MSIDKYLKRITLFPKDGQPLTQKELMNYITPMGELNYLPSVNKGMTVKVSNDGVFKVEDAWAVDFSNEKDRIKVSVTIDRVDILCEINIEWMEFVSLSRGVIGIVKENNPQGISRVAIGASLVHMSSEEEVQVFLGQSMQAAVESCLQEKSERQVFIELLTINDDENLKYNNVHTRTFTKSGYGFIETRDYDINTVVGADAIIVTSSIDLFLREGVAKLESYAVGREG